MHEELDAQEPQRRDPSHPEPAGDAQVEPRRGSVPATPRWVKVFGIIAVLLLLLLVVLHLTGNSIGGHTMHGAGG